VSRAEVGVQVPPKKLMVRFAGILTIDNFVQDFFKPYLKLKSWLSSHSDLPFKIFIAELDTCGFSK
jgi:hypothetical protein